MENSRQGEGTVTEGMVVVVVVAGGLGGKHSLAYYISLLWWL